MDAITITKREFNQEQTWAEALTWVFDTLMDVDEINISSQISIDDLIVTSEEVENEK